MGCSTLSASWATLLQALAGTLPVPFTWLRMSPICLTHSSMCGWKLGDSGETLNQGPASQRVGLRICGLGSCPHHREFLHGHR